MPATVPAVARQSTASFTREEGPGRDYLLYVPAQQGNAKRPLVVFLHGCSMNAGEAAAATRFNQAADRHGFLVAYPDQRVTPGSSAPLADGNGMGCWNWFLPDHQRRDAGEPAAIVAITREVMAEHRVDSRRVFVAGISAGGTMAVTMAAAYPDLYAAAGALAACPYATCADVTGRLAYEAMAPRARVVPMLVMQGTADTLSPAPLGAALVEAWLGTSDWADDGARNGSVSPVPASVEHRGLDQGTPQPGSGDACVRNRNWPCPGGVAGFEREYPHTVATYEDTEGRTVVESWTVHGLEHAYPGATDGGPFTDPLGPDATEALWRFFAAARRQGEETKSWSARAGPSAIVCPPTSSVSVPSGAFDRTSASAPGTNPCVDR